MGDTYVPRFWPPFFTLAGSSAIFLGYFSHPPTAKLSFGVQKLPIFTKIDLFGPKFNVFLDLFGSNFQRPAAHPHQFSGRVPPPGIYMQNLELLSHTWCVWNQFLFIAEVTFTHAWSVCGVETGRLRHTWARTAMLVWQKWYGCSLDADVENRVSIHSLTHWGWDKMAAIFQTTFFNGFSWMKIYQFRLIFHWNLFPMVQLTIFQHWFR